MRIACKQRRGQTWPWRGQHGPAWRPPGKYHGIHAYGLCAKDRQVYTLVRSRWNLISHNPLDLHDSLAARFLAYDTTASADANPGRRTQRPGPQAASTAAPSVTKFRRGRR